MQFAIAQRCSLFVTNLQRITGIWACAGGIVLLCITLVTSVNVIAFTFDRIGRSFGVTVSGLPGYEDFVSLAVGCAALMFLPYCQLKNGHIAVDLVGRIFSDKVNSVLVALRLLVAGTLAIFLCYSMIIGMFETYEDRALSPVLGWSEWPFYIPGIISLALWAMVAFTQTLTSQHRV